MYYSEPLSQENIDQILAEQAADDAKAEAVYDDMLAHPESVVDAFELLDSDVDEDYEAMRADLDEPEPDPDAAYDRARDYAAEGRED